MRLLHTIITFAALAQAVVIPTINHVVHEQRDINSKVWQKRDRILDGMVLPIRIGLKQDTLDQGHDLLMDVSNPDSSGYGRYYTAEQVAELFAPSKKTLDAVNDWLDDAGFRGRVSQSVNKAWLQFDASRNEVEKLLKTKYHFFERSSTGYLNSACDLYHVPEHIVKHIDYITPGIKLTGNGSGGRKERRNGVSKRGFGNPPVPPASNPLPPDLNSFDGSLDATDPLANCDQAITPACIRALYHVPLADKATKGNEPGIFEWQDHYSQGDLDAFFTKAAPQIKNGTHPILKSVDGGKAPVSVKEAGGESNLDFELAMPLIYPQKTILYQVDDAPTSFQLPTPGFFNTFLDAIDGSNCTSSYDGETGNNPSYDPVYPDTAKGGYKGQLQCGVYKPTNVISISYGSAESSLTRTYQRRQCHEWLKLGLQGVTVVLASGDYGVSSFSGCLGKNRTIFSPDYPATCPYLLTVGSTVVPKSGNVSTGNEVGTTNFPSGGGFSNIYPGPAYQDQAVEEYFRNAPGEVWDLPFYNLFTENDYIGADGGLYSRDGRGFPDVSAVGESIVEVSAGQQYLTSGTSASAPIWASLLNLVNEERIAAGKSTIGFVNPVLYQHPEIFNDVTIGNNTACNSPVAADNGTLIGFAASKGWDPVTGLGTPHFEKLVALFMSFD